MRGDEKQDKKSEMKGPGVQSTTAAEQQYSTSNILLIIVLIVLPCGPQRGWQQLLSR
jgi:hypothetical protein